MCFSNKNKFLNIAFTNYLTEADMLSWIVFNSIFKLNMIFLSTGLFYTRQLFQENSYDLVKEENIGSLNLDTQLPVLPFSLKLIGI